VEKSFQPGREKLIDQGTEVYALARVGAMDTDHVEFLPADDE
jgi:xanthine phosphoribosyltransferase